MANWCNYRIFIALLVPFLLSNSEKSPKKEKKWGFSGHQLINRIAVFTLPIEMFGFYKEHIDFISDHAIDPDKRRYVVEGEAACHYIDIDHYTKNGADPFSEVPKNWKVALEKYTEDTLRVYGIVPWHILVVKSHLQKAFESKNVDHILKYSAEIGHYVADAHVPLHTTENYNGQLTNQRGIHGLWETRLVELNADKYDYFVGKANYIAKINDFSWKAVEDAHRALDTVFEMEKAVSLELNSEKKYSFESRGNSTVRVYSYEFSQAYHQRLNKMVERKMRASILAVGSIWYTAWVDAGQPDLTALQHTPPSPQLLEELRTLHELPPPKSNTGRTCD
jgi:hypothetical protein